MPIGLPPGDDRVLSAAAMDVTLIPGSWSNAASCDGVGAAIVAAFA